MTALTARQHEQLLRPINPSRVGKDGKGFSHVEAYEIRAHLNRVFDFARWSADLTDHHLVFETETAKDGKARWTVCYMATVRLAVCAPDGTHLATYTEAATGEAANQPGRGDAHDLAIKTAESQAFKRCAVNLGDNFGLSLYAKGSLSPLVKQTLNPPQVATLKGEPIEAPSAPVDAHLTEQLPAESTQVEDKREVSAPKPPPERESKPQVEQFRAQALQPPADVNSMWWTRLQLDVQKAGLAKAQTTDATGTVVTLGALIQTCMRKAA